MKLIGASLLGTGRETGLRGRRVHWAQDCGSPRVPLSLQTIPFRSEVKARLICHASKFPFGRWLPPHQRALSFTKVPPMALQSSDQIKPPHNL